MSVVILRKYLDGSVESSFQIFDTSTFNVVYRHHEEAGSFFESEILQFGMLYKTQRFALVFANRPT